LMGALAGGCLGWWVLGGCLGRCFDGCLGGCFGGRVDMDAVGAVDVGAVDVGAVDVDAVDVGPWWGWARGGGVRPPGAGSWGIQHQHQLLWVGGASTGAGWRGASSLLDLRAAAAAPGSSSSGGAEQAASTGGGSCRELQSPPVQVWGCSGIRHQLGLELSIKIGWGYVASCPGSWEGSHRCQGVGGVCVCVCVRVGGRSLGPRPRSRLVVVLVPTSAMQVFSAGERGGPASRGWRCSLYMPLPKPRQADKRRHSRGWL
jgi:hypothetical protein